MSKQETAGFRLPPAVAGCNMNQKGNANITEELGISDIQYSNKTMLENLVLTLLYHHKPNSKKSKRRPTKRLLQHFKYL
jgi:hypothetical protein